MFLSLSKSLVKRPRDKFSNKKLRYGKTGQICTKKFLHEWSNMHEGTVLHGRSLLHEGSFIHRKKNM